MSKQHVVALTLALLATACSVNNTGSIPSLATGDDRLSADNSPAALLRVGDATRAGGDATSAIAIYRRAHQLAPSDPAPMTRIGSTLVDVHAYSDAVEAYRQAIQLGPKDVETRRAFAALLIAIGKPELALTHLEAALAESKDPKLYNLTGVANDLLGHHDVAQRAYSDGLKLAPDNAALSNNLGLSQALLGDFPSAIKTLGGAAGKPQASARTRQNLALAYGLAGDNEKAAAVARADLDEGSVKSNIAYYAMLRGMDDLDRAAAIVGGRPPKAKPAETADSDAPKPAPTTKVATVELAPPPTPTSPPAAAIVPATPPAAPKRVVPQRPVKLAPSAAPQADIAPGPVPEAEPKADVSATDPAHTAPPVETPIETPPVAMTAPTPDAAKTDAPKISTPEPDALKTSARDDAASGLPALAKAEPTPQSVAPLALPVAEIAARSAVAEPAADEGAGIDLAAAWHLHRPAPAAKTKVALNEPPASVETPSVETSSRETPSVQTSSGETQSGEGSPVAAAPEATAPSVIAPAVTRPTVTIHTREGHFLVQVGAFHDPEKAYKLCGDLAAKGYDFAITVGTAQPSGRDWFFCRSTVAASRADANAAAEHLRTAENTPTLLIPAAQIAKN